MISLGNRFEHGTTRISVSIEKPMQVVGTKRIGKLLRPREVVDANKSIVSHGVTDALRSELTSQLGMAVAIELQAEGTPSRHT